MCQLASDGPPAPRAGGRPGPRAKGCARLAESRVTAAECKAQAGTAKPPEGAQLTSRITSAKLAGQLAWALQKCHCRGGGVLDSSSKCGPGPVASASPATVRLEVLSSQPAPDSELDPELHRALEVPACVLVAEGLIEGTLQIFSVVPAASL